METEDSLQVKDENKVVAVDLAETLVSSIMEFGKDSHFTQSYTDYMALALEKQAELHGITGEKPAVEVFNIVR